MIAKDIFRIKIIINNCKFIDFFMLLLLLESLGHYNDIYIDGIIGKGELFD